MPTPVWVCVSPLPAIVMRPSIKSVRSDDGGIGIGIQRNWFGGVGTSSNGALRSLPCADRLERFMRHRRANAIKPRPPIRHARRSKWRAAQLLGIQTMRHFLRRILPARQYAFDRFAGEFVAEAGLVAHSVGATTCPMCSSTLAWRRLCVLRVASCHRYRFPRSRLLHLDRFKQRLEISFAESAAALALNNFEEYRRPILHRLRENLQQIAFLVAVHKYAERSQLARPIPPPRPPRRQRIIISYRERAENRLRCAAAYSPCTARPCTAAQYAARRVRRRLQ